MGKATIRERSELVVLVHGLGRTRLSMLPLEWSLERAGYDVLNWGYSSTCCDVHSLAERLSADVAAYPGQAPKRIHFVGHSLGGILIRAAIAESPPENLGRVVMLAPPNGGSAAADRYVRWVGWLLQPLSELTTQPAATVHALLPPERVEIGVIAGEFDGKVTVAESHLLGETDHVVVPSAHTLIMTRVDVSQLVISFLQSGRFDRMK
jgi:triacylglycerol lipase